jgi:hypothetical protein
MRIRRTYQKGVFQRLKTGRKKQGLQYAYWGNNPVNRIDLDGRLVWFLIPVFKGLIGDNKSLSSVVVDAASSILSGKAINGLTSNFNKAITSDLSSNAVATLTKETKAAMKQAVATVNSTSVLTGANAVADYVGKTTAGQSKEVIGSSTKRGTVSAPNKDPLILPTDAIQVNKPILPILPQ